jgi:hypothetical protein
MNDLAKEILHEMPFKSCKMTFGTKHEYFHVSYDEGRLSLSSTSNVFAKTRGCSLRLICVLTPSHCSESSFQVWVRNLKGYHFSIDVYPSTRIEDVKALIEIHEGIPRALHRILCVGRQLEDHFTLSDYGIEKDATLILVLRLK